MLKSWIDLIDENGWVGREQILGEEARSKVFSSSHISADILTKLHRSQVPAEFQTQVPTNANPPTLAMAVTAFIHRLQQDSRAAGELSDDDLGMGYAVDAAQKPMSARSNFANLESREEALKYLRSIYAPLKRHYEWFRRTQRGQIKQYSRQARSRTEGYRWRGRSAQHVLTSGMDDYPRGPPSAGELHLDLISWMAFFSRTMREIAEYIGETEDATSFFEIEKAIIDNIDGMCSQHYIVILVTHGFM
jgi:mannosyl-oligosaccharide glucosidase